MVTPESIKQSIDAGLDCRHVEVAGDGQHWEAVIVSAGLRRPVARQAASAGLRGARRPHARGGPRAVDADADARAVGCAPEWISCSSKAGSALAGEVRVSGAKNAALPILCACAAFAGAADAHQRAAAERRATRWSGCWRRWAWRSTRGTPGMRDARCRPNRLAAGALRTGQDDARVDPGAGPAARALRRGARVAARRLRDRPAARRPAREGARGDGRDDRPGARLHQRARAACAARPSCSTW